MSPRLFVRKCVRVYQWARGNEYERERRERNERHAREDRWLLRQLGA
jgi:hypothetical protein